MEVKLQYIILSYVCILPSRILEVLRIYHVQVGLKRQTKQLMSFESAAYTVHINQFANLRKYDLPLTIIHRILRKTVTKCIDYSTSAIFETKLLPFSMMKLFRMVGLVAVGQSG